MVVVVMVVVMMVVVVVLVMVVLIKAIHSCDSSFAVIQYGAGLPIHLHPNVWYNTMISRICNRNPSRLCEICRSFMSYLNPFTYARTMSPEDTVGIISHSNIVRHDQWHAFLYKLIQLSYYLYFYYLAVPFVKDPLRSPSFVKRTRHNRTISIDFIVLIETFKHNNKSSSRFYY